MRTDRISKQNSPVNGGRLLRSAAALPLAGTALSAAAAQQKHLRITGLETDLLKHPPATPFHDTIHQFAGGNGSVAPHLRTDAGITGWATSTFGMIAGGPCLAQRSHRVYRRKGLFATATHRRAPRSGGSFCENCYAEHYGNAWAALTSDSSEEIVGGFRLWQLAK